MHHRGIPRYIEAMLTHSSDAGDCSIELRRHASMVRRLWQGVAPTAAENDLPRLDKPSKGLMRSSQLSKSGGAAKSCKCVESVHPSGCRIPHVSRQHLGEPVDNSLSISVQTRSRLFDHRRAAVPRVDMPPRGDHTSRGSLATAEGSLSAVDLTEQPDLQAAQRLHSNESHLAALRATALSEPLAVLSEPARREPGGTRSRVCAVTDVEVDNRTLTG